MDACKNETQWEPENRFKQTDTCLGKTPKTDAERLFEDLKLLWKVHFQEVVLSERRF
jgi:hypothetical protein